MARKILRRPRAAQDVEEIANFIAQDSLTAALRFLEQAESTIRELAVDANLGSPFNSENEVLAGMRIRRVKRFPNHIVFFLQRENEVEVVRVIHGARDIESELTGRE